MRSLKGFGEKLKKTFAVNLAAGADFKASNTRAGNTKQFGTAHLTDNDRYSYWATDDQVTSPELLIDLKASKTFDLIRLRENIRLGQRLDSVTVEIRENNSWTRLAAVTSIGSMRLIRLPGKVTAQKLRVRLYAPVSIALSDFGLFAEAPSDPL